MTVLTADHQLLGTGRPTLPRVNLLPPEIAAQQAVRRVQLGMGVAVVASLAVVGGLYVSASHSLSSAQSDLDASRAQQTKLQQQVKSYAGVTALYAAAEQAEQQLTTAMGDEVLYSQLLNDVSLAVPSNVWLTNLSYTQSSSGPAAAAPVPGAPVSTRLGTVTFAGTAFSHDDVASWLDAMAKLKTYGNVYFTNSTESLIQKKIVFNFSGTADVTPAAESHRYDRPTGG